MSAAMPRNTLDDRVLAVLARAALSAIREPSDRIAMDLAVEWAISSDTKRVLRRYVDLILGEQA
jgi:hypothetical protein